MNDQVHRSVASGYKTAFGTYVRGGDCSGAAIARQGRGQGALCNGCVCGSQTGQRRPGTVKKSCARQGLSKGADL